MKIKIEADLQLLEKDILATISRALVRPDTKELFAAFPAGDNFKMETRMGYIRITKEPERKCRICGCTDADCRQCIQKTGTPCHWVEEDLCSACQR